jgi:hypothetical protein
MTALFFILIIQVVFEKSESASEDRRPTDNITSAIEKLALDNHVGSCRISRYQRNGKKKARFELAAAARNLQANEIFVLEPPVSRWEKSAIRKLPTSLTRASSSLYIGMEESEPRALRWKTQRAAQLPIWHPRRVNRSMCIDASKVAGLKMTAFYDRGIRNLEPFYIAVAKNVLIHPKGTFAKACGYVQSFESCVGMFKFIGKRWFQQCRHNARTSGYRWNELWNGSHTSVQTLLETCFPNGSTDGNAGQIHHPPVRYARVFVITATWDYNYGHFLTDSLVRLVYSLDFLRANKDVKIHIHAKEEDDLHAPLHRNESQMAFIKGIAHAGKVLRKRLFNFFGIDSRRVIFGPTYADTVYWPRGIRCR